MPGKAQTTEAWKEHIEIACGYGTILWIENTPVIH
jgi:hypothetical protein